MNQPINIQFLKKQTLIYLGKIISLADRDKFKSSMSPDNDWKALFAIFSAVVIIFLCVGGYLYFSTEAAGAKPKILSGSSAQVETQKIKNAADEISKMEILFGEISAKRPAVTDPSR